MDTASRTLKLALLADTKNFSTGLNNAQKQTQTFSSKVKDSAKRIGKAFAIAGVAIAGMAAKLAIDGVKAAIEDQKAQVKLATTLKNTTGASKAQTKQVEKYIDKLQRASGVADDKLRPSLGKLLIATKDVAKAQKLQSLAMDIAAGTGKDLDSVSLALAKAYGGNIGALSRMGITLDESIIKNKDFNAAAKELNKTFTGQSAAAADTMEGKFKRFNIAISEAKESIGVALMPTIENMVNFLNSPKGQKVITDFAEAFADAIKIMAKYLPGVVREVSKLVSKVAKQGLIAGLLSDPKIAVAAAAYGAGFIYGGPAGGALAAIAAYATAKGVQDVATDRASNAVKGTLLSQSSLGDKLKVTKKTKAWKKANKAQQDYFASVPEEIAMYGAQLQGNLITAEQYDAMIRKYNKTHGGKNYPTIVNITVNGAADSRESARAIDKALKKVNLNGGSLAGSNGFN